MRRVSGPLVSVVMPAYNAERYVASAVESVMAQTWEGWELIVVDDGSTDATSAILGRYADPRIKVIHQENAGEAAARNVGLDRASGEWLAFLDADDLYLPSALEDHLGYLASHPACDVSYSDGYFCDADGRKHMRLSEHRPAVVEGSMLEPLILSASYISGIICTMTKRSIIVDKGIRFDPDLTIGPDWDFWIQVARHATFGYLDKVTCLYRIHDTNVTRTSGRGKRNEDLIRGRAKLLQEDWLGDLSVATRQALFEQYLVGLLSGQVDRQQTVVVSTPFLQLPVSARVSLLRHVASDSVVNHENTAFAQECLLHALELAPRDFRALAMERLVRGDRRVARAAIGHWAAAVRTARSIRDLRRRQPKAVPSGLAPVGD